MPPRWRCMAFMASREGTLLASLVHFLDPRRAWSRFREVVGRDWDAGLLLVAMSAYVVVMSIFCVFRLNSFQTHAFDLGIFNQAFSTALQGRLFYETPDIHVIPSGSF